MKVVIVRFGESLEYTVRGMKEYLYVLDTHNIQRDMKDCVEDFKWGGVYLIL